MVAFKAAQTTKLLGTLPGAFDAALLYGPEPGLVSDRAEQLARRLAAAAGPSAEIVRIDDSDLAADPARLAVETRTGSLFGGARIVRFKSGARTEGVGLADLLDQGLACFLIVEAGSLRPSAKLRQSFERAKRAAALPCYGESGSDIARVIDDELGRAKLAIDREAKAHLAALLSADPGLARQEVAKLALYAGEARTITAEHVAAIVGDTGQAGLDALAAAAASGDATEALRQLDRLTAGGTALQAALIALARHFERLHRLLAAAESGDGLNEALNAMRPPLHFRQREVLSAQARRWSRARVARAIALLKETTRVSRLTPDLERALVERTLVSLAAIDTLVD